MIHKFTVNGERFVLDVNSGALHLVDEVVWDLLDDYGRRPREELFAACAQKYPPDEVAGALAEIEQLAAEGALFSEDTLRGSWEPPEHGIVKALCLHLAHDCNLRCRYCFGAQGTFSGPRSLMPADVGRRAVDFLLAFSGPRRHVEIDFFGGEPLLNFAVLRELVAYGREKAARANKEIKFTVTTNAVLLNDQVGDYLAENQISVILSLDGRPPVHDRMRVFPDGSGSYAKVIAKISRFLRAHPDADYYLRGTFTRANPDFAADVLHMAGLGFTRISLEPVVAVPGEGYALREEDLPVVFAEYERLAAELASRAGQGREIDFYHFNIDLEGGPCLPRRLSGCGAGCDYLAVTPEGDLYPCHQFVGRRDYLLGDVERGIIRNDLRELFRHAHIYNKEGCGECWARFYCSGGCHASAQAFNNDIHKPCQLACRLMQKRLECALYYQAGRVRDQKAGGEGTKKA
ncbi:MAG: thioether cross-link-forming SCIFF peptide maturase [Bacillota bacterium]